MIKNIFFSAAILALSGYLLPVQAQKTKQGTATAAKSDVKFLEDITVDAPPVQPPVSDAKAAFATSQFTIRKDVAEGPAAVNIEHAGSLQFKYALLLDQEVEQIRNLALFRLIDEWLGTRYRLGGSSKEGIDCSALTQVFFTSLYSISLPRTAREQFGLAHKISMTELKAGDLVFFNTVGGV